MLSQLRLVWLRRSVVVVTTPIYAALLVLICMADGACRGCMVAADDVREAWRGS